MPMVGTERSASWTFPTVSGTWWSSASIVGAAVALTVVQVRSGHALYHLVGLPEG
jgi:hypothetical protein